MTTGLATVLPTDLRVQREEQPLRGSLALPSAADSARGSLVPTAFLPGGRGLAVSLAVAPVFGSCQAAPREASSDRPGSHCHRAIHSHCHPGTRGPGAPRVLVCSGLHGVAPEDRGGGAARAPPGRLLPAQRLATDGLSPQVDVQAQVAVLASFLQP